MRIGTFVLGAFACAIAIWVVFHPLFSCTYPPITDLPMHASHTAIFRHYFDPDWHFREQFELAPLAVPYDSSYALGALLSLGFSMVTAVKLATGLMLLAIPGGMATLAWGMRKSPLLGLCALPLVWAHLTHWGFINFVSALGMFACAIGLAMRAVDRPSRRTEIALAFVLTLVFFTHIFRYPMALVGVLVTGVVLYPATQRLRPILWPLVPSLVLFAIWWVVHPAAVSPDLGPLHVETSRVHDIAKLVVDGFDDPAEWEGAKYHLQIVALEVVIGAVAAFFARRSKTRKAVRFDRLAAFVAFGAVLCLLGLYLTLPMEIGAWWYVYPREATAVVFVAIALCPDLPKATYARVGLVVALAFSSLAVERTVTKHYVAFEKTTKDFRNVTARIPRAPKLLYLVFDHTGTKNTTTPFIHLPAWVQAEKGGWLSFHFAVFESSPVSYREGEGAVVPPAVPVRWEWTPDRYDHWERGRFFDWFLIRSSQNPNVVFDGDKSIVLEAHEGTFWLYRRRQYADVTSQR